MSRRKKINHYQDPIVIRQVNQSDAQSVINASVKPLGYTKVSNIFLIFTQKGKFHHNLHI